MMVVRAMPVSSWMRSKLTPAAEASRITSSRRALASAQARSSFSAACGVFARPPPALLLGPAARPARTAAVRAWPLGA